MVGFLVAVLLQMFPDLDSEMFENQSIFDEVKANEVGLKTYKKVCQFLGHPVGHVTIVI